MTAEHTRTTPLFQALEQRLHEAVEGEVRFDPGSRAAHTCFSWSGSSRSFACGVTE